MAVKLRPAVLCLVFFLLAATFAGGCGAEQGDEARQVEQQEGFGVDRLPGIGSVYEYYLNDPLPADSQGIPVNFASESAWDFSSGPTENVAKATFVSPQGMPGSELFPGSDLCLKSEVYGETAYIYYLQDTEARRLMGLFIATGEGQGFWEKYDPPKTILRFPIEPPSAEPQLEDIYYTTSGGFTETISCRYVVRWFETMTVPAGEFPDTAMLQYFDIHTNSGGRYTEISYAWYAPDVGQVAYIRSLPDETQPAFTRAADFRRLASYQVVK